MRFESSLGASGPQGGRSIQNAAGVRGRDPLDPAVVGRHRAVQAHPVLLDDVADRTHRTGGQIKFEARPVLPALVSVASPVPEGRPQIAQTLEREEVGAERYDEGIGRDESGTVDGTEAGPDVDQDDLRAARS